MIFGLYIYNSLCICDPTCCYLLLQVCAYQCFYCSVFRKKIQFCLVFRKLLQQYVVGGLETRLLEIKQVLIVTFTFYQFWKFDSTMAGSESNSSSSKSAKGQSLLPKVYLLGYNFAQVIGWSYLLYQIISHYVKGESTNTLWNEVILTVSIFQNAAVLEILNVAFGLVKSNLMITIFQVFSRVMVVCGLLLVTPTAPLSFGLPLALFAWSITEIIRYLYYALNIVNMVPYTLIWCRYTFFYALYPIGVTGELLCFYAAQTHVAKTNMWSYTLPNTMNFTFSYRYFLLFIMFLYIPLFPQMYLHMVSQRKKIIGGVQPSKKSK